MKTLVVLFLSIGFYAQALECTGIIVTDTESVEGDFTVSDETRGHGGEEFSLIGKESSVIFMADKKWLGISWYKNGELIAESVNLLRDGVEQPKVLIMYNPKNTDEQVSINCAG